MREKSAPFLSWHSHRVMRPAAVFGAVATVILLALVAARAEPSGSDASPAALQPQSPAMAA